ncbi:MAG: hypothetical protein IPI08_15345 [Betaproteobacteria bacterium]|nr:hypothetical protein [Betaproteobacteria bacterium]
MAQGQPTAAALASARECIEHAIERLQSLADRHATAARCSLIGSACKRLGMLEQRAGRAAAASAALDAAARGYGQAEALAAAAGSSDLFYPGLNRMALELGYANIHARLNANKAWRTRGKEQAAAQALLDQLLGYARGPAGR